MAKVKRTVGGTDLNKLASLLRKLVNTRLENFSTVDQCLQTICDTTENLQDTEFSEMKSQVLIAFNLAGLPADIHLYDNV